jgi:hypothetical protein
MMPPSSGNKEIAPLTTTKHRIPEDKQKAVKGFKSRNS